VGNIPITELAINIMAFMSKPQRRIIRPIRNSLPVPTDAIVGMKNEDLLSCLCTNCLEKKLLREDHPLTNAMFLFHSTGLHASLLMHSQH